MRVAHSKTAHCMLACGTGDGRAIRLCLLPRETLFRHTLATGVHWIAVLRLVGLAARRSKGDRASHLATYCDSSSEVAGNARSRLLRSWLDDGFQNECVVS